MATSSAPNPSAPTGDVPLLTERLFRDESGKLVATLTRLFGINHLELAEDVVQEALAKALRLWPYYGIPANPAGWITQTAKNLALDTLRREKTFQGKQPSLIASLEQNASPSPQGDRPVFDEHEIQDDRLRLLFVCCHPALPQEAQVALALKTLCGFSTLEIARAFLATEASIAKRLTRAKQRLREAGIPFEVPSGTELSARLEAVLQTLYFLFNEGYKASGGNRLVREELCWEAIRLMLLLVEHPSGNKPATHALLALMLFNAARLSTRSDEDGALLQLAEQDRKKWDPKLIARGMAHLIQSATGNEVSEYHLQAAIAGCHCSATDYESTDWKQILALYDQFLALNPSPVVALNRAIAMANVHGLDAAIKVVEPLTKNPDLKSYHLLHAVLGDLHFRAGHLPEAALEFQTALGLAQTESERAFLKKRIGQCRA